MTGPARLRHPRGGEWKASGSDRWIADLDPSNAADVSGEMPGGTADDVSAALNAAVPAFEGWRSTNGPVRAEFLDEWAAAITAREHGPAAHEFHNGIKTVQIIS